MSISPTLVRELRQKTGAGMMDCKKALVESSGDLEAAVDWLRKQGLSSAAKKAERATEQGLVTVTVGDARAGLVEINCETDFVARTPQFLSFLQEVGKVALSCGDDLTALAKASFGDHDVETERKNMVASLGENIQIRRITSLESAGCLGTYVHNGQGTDCGTLAVIVSMSCSAPHVEIDAFAKNLAMHLAAQPAQSITVEALDPAALEREKTVLKEQIIDSGKPPEIAEKMLTGRLRKFYQEVVLLEQAYVMDPNQTVGQALGTLAESVGQEVHVAGFARFAVGAA
ncbi:MAG: translation elongation factor Ts [Pseudomonadota bacterium]